MSKRRLASTLVCACIALTTGCTASDEDCEAFGAKYAELFGEESADNPLSPSLLEKAANAGKREATLRCKEERPKKSGIERCLAAKTMDEFESC